MIIGVKEEKMRGMLPERYRFVVLALVFLLSAACAMISCASSSPWTTSSSTTSGPATPAATSQMRPMPYDFPDILVPRELELSIEDSYVFQGPKMKAGLLVFKGRVDPRSLIDFFQSSMPRENWQFKGGFRYKRSILVFEKTEKICLINISEGIYYTYVHIYVTPMGSQV